MDPDNHKAKQLRTRIKAVERLKEEGNVFFKQNQWQEAINKYDEALEVRIHCCICVEMGVDDGGQ
jgi:DnaJ family protein C protein 7